MMRNFTSLITGAALILSAGLIGCGGDDGGDLFDSLTTAGNGDGDDDTTGDGDGDGDGDTTTGDGDGDTAGDGDGDTAGDGDGDVCGGIGEPCGTGCCDGLTCDMDGTCSLGGGDGDGDGDGDDPNFPDIGPNNACPATYFPDGGMTGSGKCLPACDPQDPADMNACPAGSQCAVAVYGVDITAETCTTAADCVDGLQADCLDAGGGGLVCIYFQTACADDAECSGLQGTNPMTPPGCWPLQGGDSCATLHCSYPG